jgi:hypothetical protein
MDWDRFAMERLKNAPLWLRYWVEKRIKTVPAIRNRIEEKNRAALTDLEKELKPYREGFLSFVDLP